MAFRFHPKQNDELMAYVPYIDGEPYVIYEDNRPFAVMSSPPSEDHVRQCFIDNGVFLSTEHKQRRVTTSSGRPYSQEVYSLLTPSTEVPKNTIAFGKIEFTSDATWTAPHSGEYKITMSGGAGYHGGFHDSSYSDFFEGVQGKNGELVEHNVYLQAGDILSIKIGKRSQKRGTNAFFPDPKRDPAEYKKEFERMRGGHGEKTIVTKTTGDSFQISAKGGSGGNFQGAFHHLDVWSYSNGESNNLGSGFDGYVIIEEVFQNRILNVQASSTETSGSLYITKDMVLLAAGNGRPSANRTIKPDGSICPVKKEYFMLSVKAGEFVTWKIHETSSENSHQVLFCGVPLGRLTRDDHGINSIKQIHSYDNLLEVYDVTNIYEEMKVRANEK